MSLKNKVEKIFNSSCGKISYYFKGSQKILVLSHGFASHKDKRRFKVLREKLEKNNIGFLFFDYPGHGNSEKKEFDLNCFIKTLKEIIKLIPENREIYFLCESIGCLFLALALKELKINTKNIFMVGPFLKPKLLNVFYKYPQLFAELLNKGKIVIGNRKYIITKNFIEQIFSLDYEETYNVLKEKNKIILYGEKDEAIEYKIIKEISEKINSNVLIIKDGDHILEEKYQLFTDLILSFIKL